MKLTVSLLLLAAVTQAVQVGGNQDKKAEEKTDKRELTEGNAGLDKRAPILPTASSALTGGIEYADTKTTSPDKSPSQQTYATPVPNVAKVSDLLTAQGPSYQDAIASHLYSPISIYQTRFGPPTTYEVSAPVSSNLAYSEHRLSLPSPNTIQYSAKSQKLVKPIVANYEQPQVLVQQSYEQNLAPIQSVQQASSSPINNYQQIQYNPSTQQGFTNQQELQYIQEQPHQFQAGIAFRQEHQFSQGRSHQQPEQRDLKSQPISSGILEKQVVQQVFSDKQQPALSYARFSVNQGAPSYQQNQLQQAHQLPQSQALFQAQQLIQPQQQHPQHFIPTQPQQYQPQPLAQISYQLQHPTKQLSQIQYEAPQETRQPLQSNIQNHLPQPQIQYQEQPQYLYQQLQEQALHQQRLLSHSAQDQSQYQFQPQQYHFQPQLFNEKPDLAQSQQAISERLSLKQSAGQPPIQNLGYQGLPAALPTFPPVQYFGKLANSLLSGYQH